MFEFSNFVGYSETQCKIITLLWYLLITLRDCLISLILLNPVDIIIGFFVFAISLIKFKSVISPFFVLKILKL